MLCYPCRSLPNKTGKVQVFSHSMSSMTTPSTQRHLVSFDDQKTNCNRVSVKDEATYCIEGAVCGAIQNGQRIFGACPKKETAAIDNCTPKSRSFLTGCVAPVDATCVLQSTNNWGCVFLENNNGGNMNEATVQVEPISPSKNDLALSASAKEPNAIGAIGASINIAVVVACCVLAFVGLVLVKKRRNRERLSPYTLSEKDISIVTL